MQSDIGSALQDNLTETWPFGLSFFNAWTCCWRHVFVPLVNRLILFHSEKVHGWRGKEMRVYIFDTVENPLEKPGKRNNRK